MNCCKPEQMGTKEYSKMMKIIQALEDGRVPAKDARSWRIEGKEKNYEKRVSEAFKQARHGRFHGPKRIVESRLTKGAAGQGRVT